MTSILTNAVTIYNGQITTTSLKISEVFGKQHKHVLDAIEKLQVPDSFGKPNFRPTEYEWKNNLGKITKSKMYIITRDGFTLLVMGFTGAKAMQYKIAYIEAFNRMEAELRRLQSGALSQPELPLEKPSLPELRMKYRGTPVIPSVDLAKRLLITTDQLAGLVSRNKLVPVVDYFPVKGVTDKLARAVRRAGYAMNPDAITINLYTENGVRKIVRMVESNTRLKRLEPAALEPAAPAPELPAPAKAPAHELNLPLRESAGTANRRPVETLEQFFRHDAPWELAHMLDTLKKAGYDTGVASSELAVLLQGALSLRSYACELRTLKTKIDKMFDEAVQSLNALCGVAGRA